MLGRMLAAALAAGLIAGLAISAVQHVTTTPLILAAEVYEEGGGAPAAAPHGAHPDDATAWILPTDGPERMLRTAAANVIAGVGFALLLVAAFAVHGGAIDGRRGVLWGAAGFAAFALNPSLGLPPELPGTVAADLAVRQVWWAFAVASTAVGLGLVVFGRRAVPVGLGALTIALPHLVGAPHPAGEAGGPVPPELAARFAAASLAVAALFWVLLGASSGALYRRLVADADAGAAPRAAIPRRRIGDRTG